VLSGVEFDVGTFGWTIAFQLSEMGGQKHVRVLVWWKALLPVAATTCHVTSFTLARPSCLYKVAKVCK